MGASSNEQSYKGTFYLPDAPEDTVVGTLTISKEGEGHLELLGAFEVDNLFSRRGMTTIWGTLFSGGKISLIDSYRGQSSWAAGGALITYKVGTTVIGMHLLSCQQSLFKTISAEIEHLQEWINIDGGAFSCSFDGKSATYTYIQPDDINFMISDGLSGGIFFRADYWIGSSFGNEFSQTTRFELETATPKSLNEMIRALMDFRNLVSIFVGQRLQIKQWALTSDEVEMEFIDEKPNRKPILKDILIYFKDTSRYSKLPEHPIVFVKYNDIAVHLSNITQNWCQLLQGELRPVAYILMEALADHRNFEEGDFMSAWRGVEAFHRLVMQDTNALKKPFKTRLKTLKTMITDDELRGWVVQTMCFAYEPTAKERLKSIINEYRHLMPFEVTDEKIANWVKEMANTRNYLTHYDPSMSSKKASGRQLYLYTCLLRWILLVLFLTKLGLDQELLKNLARHQNLDFEKLASSDYGLQNYIDEL